MDLRDCTSVDGDKKARTPSWSEMGKSSGAQAASRVGAQPDKIRGLSEGARERTAELEVL